MYGVIPSLRFPDLAEAIGFYVEQLGFEVVRGDLADGNVAVQRNYGRLMLEAAGSFYVPGYDDAIRERLGTRSPNALYIEEPDLAAYHDRLQAAGVKVVDPLAERSWGQAEFTVEDVAGNWLSFYAALGSSS